jgi:hypothetical protein
MTKAQVIDLMQSSQTVQDWNKNADTVKAAFNGDYPNWWYEAIIISGVADKTLAKIGVTADIGIS